jgi:hypothetical protein
VKWGDQYSDWFQIIAGVRQGGVLSPILYCLYINDMVSLLSHSKVGCYYKGLFLSILLYADDMAIIAPSLKALQLLLKLCESFCVEWDINLNAKKTKLMAFGTSAPNFVVTMNTQALEWAATWKYLGVELRSTGGKFMCSSIERIKKFYKSANSIFRIDGRSQDLTMLRLVESHCVPILSYCIDSMDLTTREMQNMRTAYNSLFRRIFHFRCFDSVSELQGFLGSPTWEELVQKRKVNLQQKAKRSDNVLIKKIIVPT